MPAATVHMQHPRLRRRTFNGSLPAPRRDTERPLPLLRPQLPERRMKCPYCHRPLVGEASWGAPDNPVPIAGYVNVCPQCHLPSIFDVEDGALVLRRPTAAERAELLTDPSTVQALAAAATLGPVDEPPQEFAVLRDRFNDLWAGAREQWTAMYDNTRTISWSDMVREGGPMILDAECLHTRAHFIATALREKRAGRWPKR